MALSKIKVKPAAGSVSEITGNVRFAAGSDNVSVTSKGNTVTLSSRTEKSIYEKAYDDLILTPYVSQISGVGPDSTGAFFINGSGCWDWYYKDAAKEGPNKISNALLVLNDLCSSCSSCEATVRMKKLAEHFKVVFNILKDANLYDTDTVKERKAYLDSKRMKLTENCSSALTAEDKNRLNSISVFGNRLLGEYLTAVHMWNYLVSNKRTSTSVDVAKDDPSGMSVASTATSPGCDKGTQVSVTSVVSQVSGQPGLSLYVPKVSAAASGAVSSSGEVVSMLSPTSVSVTTSTGDGSGAGAIGFAANVHPYFHVQLQTGTETGGWEDTTLAAWNPSELAKSTEPDGKGGDTVTYNRMKLRALVSQVTDGTREDYLQSRSLPSRIENGKNLWKIETTVTRTGTLAGEEKSTYYFETPYIPVPDISAMESGLSLSRIIAP